MRPIELKKEFKKMIRYFCPICNKRACDSQKTIRISKLSRSNENKADIIIKCQNCKNSLAVKVIKDTSVSEQMGLPREVIS